MAITKIVLSFPANCQYFWKKSAGLMHMAGAEVF
jgi:hypothetical protein